MNERRWWLYIQRCVTATAAAAVRSHITVAQVVRSGRRVRLSCPIYASSSPEDLSVVYASRRRPSVYNWIYTFEAPVAYLHLLERRCRRRPTNISPFAPQRIRIRWAKNFFKRHKSAERKKWLSANSAFK